MESLVQPLRAYEHWLAQYRRLWEERLDRFGTALQEQRKHRRRRRKEKKA